MVDVSIGGVAVSLATTATVSVTDEICYSAAIALSE